MEDYLHDIKNLNIGKVEEDCSLKNYTTYRTGGIARCIVYPKNVACFVKLVHFLKSNDISFKILGYFSSFIDIISISFFSI